MFTGRIWRGVMPALAIGLSIVATDFAAAAPGSAACRSIEAQLASGGGKSSNRKFSAAAEKQRREISILRRQMSAAGCGLFNASPRCASLSRLASRMNSNLSKLSAKAGGGGRSRAQLLAALDANDCRRSRKPAVREAKPAARESSPGILARLFGEPERRSAPREALGYWSDDKKSDGARIIKRKTESRDDKGSRDRIASTPTISDGLAPGTMRTFCVRTCDGYYFPMSPASTKDDMARDEKNCQAACPGAETALYYHEDGQEDAEAMISRASGKPYDKLKTAFVYREASTLKSPQCTCAIQPGTLKIASADGDETGKPSKLIPLPVNRPDPATDPETLANRDGELDNAATRRLLSKDGDDLKLAERTVRVVGPVFLPDPSTAEVRPAPAQTAVP